MSRNVRALAALLLVNAALCLRLASIGTTSSGLGIYSRASSALVLLAIGWEVARQRRLAALRSAALGGALGSLVWAGLFLYLVVHLRSSGMTPERWDRMIDDLRPVLPRFLLVWFGMYVSLGAAVALAGALARIAIRRHHGAVA